MSKNESKRVIQIPDYLEGQPKNVIEEWKKWEELSYQITNFPNRFVDCVNPKTGDVRTFDCLCPPGIIQKALNNFGVEPSEAQKIIKISKEVQVLKTEKGRQNTRWSKHVFGKKAGEGTILSVRSSELLELYGKYYTTDEIMKIIQRDWGFSVKYEALKDFYNNNLDKIERKRAEFVIKGKETRLATDAGRMELLSSLAWEMEAKFLKTKSLEVSKELRSIIEQIRKEVKGEEIRLTIDGKIDIQATIQANQSLHEALGKLPINMIIIGLTAAKQKVNPAHIIASLTNSYYSKFNGFNELKTKEDIMLPGQFIKNYDWNQIRMYNEENIQDVEAIEVYEKIPEQKVEEIEDQKTKLLKLLNQFKEKVDN